jgi:hypothetical protein
MINNLKLETKIPQYEIRFIMNAEMDDVIEIRKSGKINSSLLLSKAFII